ncbi:MAG: electron transfer flavoprotein subunit beta/FixA family protein [Desulfosarcina sp.]|nr:electron transfer flavoprotein subunit beta/FixA family protein [Desulfobacterales bacterium]
MKILVCVKWVPEIDAVETQREYNAETLTPAHWPHRMNRYDEYALEAALQIRACEPDTRIDALTVGPPEVEPVLKRAMGMGADNGIHIVYPQPGLVSPLVVAALLSGATSAAGYDLILCGIQSEDLMQGVVGPALAENLDIPAVTAVIAMCWRSEENQWRVEREIEEGRREVMALSPPALFSIQSGINRPRYPSLSNLLRANRRGVQCIPAADLDIPSRRQRVVRLVHPVQMRAAKMLKGSPEQKAVELAGIFRAKGFLK